MSDFRTLSDKVMASPQITPDQLAEAQALGVTLVINNRPDGEAEDQPPGAEIEGKARSLGLGYIAIPIDHSGFSAQQVEAMNEALAQAEGKVLAYCRSGTRSTLLWALARASQGHDPQEVAAAAERAGYDVSVIRDAMEQLASRRDG